MPLDDIIEPENSTNDQNATNEGSESSSKEEEKVEVEEESARIETLSTKVLDWEATHAALERSKRK